MKGKWRIVEMPDYEGDYADMMEPAYIQLDGEGGGEFAFGCVTGSIYEAGDGDAIEFSWTGNDEMDEASGDGWVEIQPDGTIKGQVCFDRGDDVDFAARPWTPLPTKR